MILFVDDEERPINTFMEELTRSGYDVKLETTIEGALRYFRANFDQIQLVVLDIMMPYGEVFSAAETEGGLRTGVRLYKKLREESRELPVIIFTNVSAQPIEEAFSDQPRCRFLTKIDFFPFEFREEVASMLSRSPSGD
jgi:CheY-like chemotaxis protein